jgi:hypothetical protein
MVEEARQQSGHAQRFVDVFATLHARCTILARSSDSSRRHFRRGVAD